MQTRIMLCSSYPQLKELPEEISKLTALRELDVSYNELEAMPEGIGELTCLATLRANDNCLKKLPLSFSSLRSLQHLNLQGKHFRIANLREKCRRVNTVVLIQRENKFLCANQL